MKGIEMIELNLQDEAMMTALLPHYQNYEAEISHEALEDIFPADAVQENYAYFREYFEGCITYICMEDGAFKGFVKFHKDTEERPGYADGYQGWGHMADIYTIKQSRGLGLGTMMVKRAEEAFRKFDIKGIYLTDLSGNPAFWQSLGYIDTGKIEPQEGGRIYEKPV